MRPAPRGSTARRANERMGHTVDDLADHGGLAVDPDAGRSIVIAEAGAPSSGSTSDRPAPEGSRPATGPRPCCPVLGGSRNRRTDHRRQPAANAVPRLAYHGAGRSSSVAAGSTSGHGPSRHRRGARVCRPTSTPECSKGLAGRHDGEPRSHVTPGSRLTISRQLSRRTVAMITIESEDGVGSTFTVWFPLNRCSQRRHRRGRWCAPGAPTCAHSH